MVRWWSLGPDHCLKVHRFTFVVVLRLEVFGDQESQDAMDTGHRAACLLFFNNLPRSNPDVTCYWLNWTPEDFYNVRKVDTHIHHSAVDWPAWQFRFQNLKWSIYWFYWWGILMKATGMNWLGHLLTEAMNAKHLLRFMKKKLKRFSEDIVDVVSAAFGVQIQDKDLYLGFTRKKPISLPVIQNWTWTMCPTCQGLVF